MKSTNVAPAHRTRFFAVLLLALLLSFLAVAGLGETQPGADALSVQSDSAFQPYPATTNEAAVNLRQSTSTKSSKIGQLKRGELLTVLAEMLNEAGETWCNVQLADGTVGYIRSDLLSPVTQEYAVSAAAAAAQSLSGSSSAQAASGAKASSSSKSGSSSKTSSSSSGGSGSYIGNKNKKVFHKSSCSFLPAPKNQVRFDSRDAALSKGYRACQKCHP